MTKARILAGTAKNIALLARRLQDGEIVGVPTETVYGLAANALDARACKKIFTAKGRPPQDPLIVHIHSLEQLYLVCKPNDLAIQLARGFWPGALTMVLPKKSAVPELVTAGRDSVAVRMPSHPVFRRLLEKTGLPLAAPSANPFGYISPTSAEHVRQNLGTKIRYILDGGPCRIGLESTILDLRNPRRPRILRTGGITIEDLQARLGRPLTVTRRKIRTTPAASGEVAPGMMARHYSPRTPVTLHTRISKTAGQSKPAEAFVFLQKPASPTLPNVFWLDDRGDLGGAARRLFAILRQIDRMKFERIHIERAPERGIGQAINDRLRRAAAK